MMFGIGEDLTLLLDRSVTALERMADALEEQTRLMTGDGAR